MENKEETLTSCRFAAKTLKHKNNLASYAGSRDFQSAELSFPHPNVSVNDFYFQVKSHEHFFKLQLHTHHSLDFIRELKMLKITGYIHLHYKIPFYVAMLALVSFFFFFLIIHREFCFNMFSV